MNSTPSSSSSIPLCRPEIIPRSKYAHLSAVIARAQQISAGATPGIPINYNKLNKCQDIAHEEWKQGLITGTFVHHISKNECITQPIIPPQTTSTNN